MKPSRSCEIYIDGASRGNPGPAGAGAVFLDLPAPPQNVGGAQAGGAHTPVRELSKPLGHTTNNVAEYLALIYALQEALQAGYNTVAVKTDSELLVRQLSGEYRVRDPQLKLFHDLAVHLRKGFARCEISHVPRAENRLADALAGRAADRG